MRLPLRVVTTWLGCAGLSLGSLAAAETAAPTPTPPAKADVEKLIDQAEAWLTSKQNADGSFAKDQFALGITALATGSLVTQPHGMSIEDPVIAKAFAYLKSNQQPDGGIYLTEQGLGNYCTALTLMAIAASGQTAKEKALVDKAHAYLFGLQVPSGKMVGGIGYDQEDGKDHQDLPNTGLAVMGLAATGVPASDPHMQAALKFLQHCQNLSSVNDMPWVDNSSDALGSAVYSPNESQANGSFQEKSDKPADSTKPGTPADPTKPGTPAAPATGTASSTDTGAPVKKLVGTGSMTYTLISSYVALDLKADDPRVAAALEWCKHNYRFDANPGMVTGHEHEGLLYYYMLMGKTMHVLHIKTMQLPDGRTVDWRADLFKAIKALSHPVPLPGGKQGAIFMNDAKRWGETFPHLATAYLIQSLKDIDDGL